MCLKIGEKTNVYSLEVSMHGREVPISPEKQKLLPPDQKFEVEPYTVEDCNEIFVISVHRGLSYLVGL